jgi:hypothetical protein
MGAGVVLEQVKQRDVGPCRESMMRRHAESGHGRGAVEKPSALERARMRQIVTPLGENRWRARSPHFRFPEEPEHLHEHTLAKQGWAAPGVIMNWSDESRK